ncbi:unnamed protein product [Bursaphelenchus xylophilus]|uniref:(pine wood nematode) hypothetical protein n=1 Tax=Bursaphelenchus xylophilus TaxID=6326 RepID=A0A1I7S6P2_BURXY|nr:unnamed protein product [Bursaphelenchus xylophilus]CAG9120635.1 unnamed protein product [Bursaphelenchus xylophilus]
MNVIFDIWRRGGNRAEVRYNGAGIEVLISMAILSAMLFWPSARNTKIECETQQTNPFNGYEVSKRCYARDFLLVRREKENLKFTTKAYHYNYFYHYMFYSSFSIVIINLTFGPLTVQGKAAVNLLRNLDNVESSNFLEKISHIMLYEGRKYFCIMFLVKRMANVLIAMFNIQVISFLFTRQPISLQLVLEIVDYVINIQHREIPVIFSPDAACEYTRVSQPNKVQRYVHNCIASENHAMFLLTFFISAFATWWLFACASRFFSGALLVRKSLASSSLVPDVCLMLQLINPTTARSIRLELEKEMLNARLIQCQKKLCDIV